MTGRNGRYSQSLGSPSASKLPCFALVRNDRHAIAGYPNEATLGFCESRTKMPTLADATSTQAPFPILRRAFRQLSRLSPAASLDTINPQPYHRPEFLTVVSMRSFFVKTQPSANAPSILCFQLCCALCREAAFSMCSIDLRGGRATSHKRSKTCMYRLISRERSM